MEAGSRLGPYEILAPVGAGGMGATPLARDYWVGGSTAFCSRNPQRG